MRRTTKTTNRAMHVPLMYAFRDGFEQKDSDKKIDNRVDGQRVISKRGSMSRLGAKDSELRRNLSIDLAMLVNTIDLGSVEELDGLDRVARSVINFGLPDISHMTSEEQAADEIADDLRNALLAHEPRLERKTLVVKRTVEKEAESQRVRFEIEAEMLARPVNLQLEFVAEVDVHSGKVQLSRLGHDV